MRKRVLLIDDSVTIHKIVALTIDRQSFELISAYSMDEGLRMATEKHPDIILVDNKLCSDGACIEDLHRIVPGAPVILLVGAYDHLPDEDFKDYDITDYLVKPFNSSTLNQALNDATATQEHDKQASNQQPPKTPSLSSAHASDKQPAPSSQQPLPPAHAENGTQHGQSESAATDAKIPLINHDKMADEPDRRDEEFEMLEKNLQENVDNIKNILAKIHDEYDDNNSAEDEIYSSGDMNSGKLGDNLIPVEESYIDDAAGQAAASLLPATTSAAVNTPDNTQNHDSGASSVNSTIPSTTGSTYPAADTAEIPQEQDSASGKQDINTTGSHDALSVSDHDTDDEEPSDAPHNEHTAEHTSDGDKSATANERPLAIPYQPAPVALGGSSVNTPEQNKEDTIEADAQSATAPVEQAEAGTHNDDGEMPDELVITEDGSGEIDDIDFSAADIIPLPDPNAFTTEPVQDIIPVGAVDDTIDTDSQQSVTIQDTPDTQSDDDTPQDEEILPAPSTEAEPVLEDEQPHYGEQYVDDSDTPVTSTAEPDDDRDDSYEIYDDILPLFEDAMERAGILADEKPDDEELEDLLSDGDGSVRADQWDDSDGMNTYGSDNDQDRLLDNLYDLLNNDDNKFMHEPRIDNTDTEATFKREISERRNIMNMFSDYDHEKTFSSGETTGDAEHKYSGGFRRIAELNSTLYSGDASKTFPGLSQDTVEKLIKKYLESSLLETRIEEIVQKYMEKTLPELIQRLVKEELKNHTR